MSCFHNFCALNTHRALEVWDDRLVAIYWVLQGEVACALHHSS